MSTSSPCRRTLRKRSPVYTRLRWRWISAARWSDCLECLRSPVEASILGSSIKREIAYRVLCGPRRNTLLAMLGTNGDQTRIHTILRSILARYSEALTVAAMAEESGMSISAFHHHFRAIKSASPLQYLKALRLHKARMFILHDGLGAAVAADRVGYESASQFSREFKRLFGHSPSECCSRVA